MNNERKTLSEKRAGKTCGEAGCLYFQEYTSVTTSAQKRLRDTSIHVCFLLESSHHPANKTRHIEKNSRVRLLLMLRVLHKVHGGNK